MEFNGQITALLLPKTRISIHKSAVKKKGDRLLWILITPGEMKHINTSCDHESNSQTLNLFFLRLCLSSQSTNCFQWQVLVFITGARHHIQIGALVMRIKIQPVFCGSGELCHTWEMTSGKLSQLGLRDFKCLTKSAFKLGAWHLKVMAFFTRQMGPNKKIQGKCGFQHFGT